MAILYQHNADTVYGPGVREILINLLPVPSSTEGREMSAGEDRNTAGGDPSLNNE
jgi:hypothetical protein